MPKQSYSFEPGGQKRLEISWGAYWKNMTVSLDGQPVGQIHSQKELLAGQTFNLPDGSRLKVQLIRRAVSTELQVLRNELPLPGSASDPHTRLKTAYHILLFLGGLNLVLGLLAALFQIQLLLDLGLGLFSIVYGVLFLALAYYTKRRSYLALLFAITLFTLDSLLTVGLMLAAGQTTVVSNLLVRGLLIFAMLPGLKAIKDLNQMPEPTITPV